MDKKMEIRLKCVYKFKVYIKMWYMKHISVFIKQNKKY